MARYRRPTSRHRGFAPYLLDSRDISRGRSGRQVQLDVVFYRRVRPGANCGDQRPEWLKLELWARSLPAIHRAGWPFIAAFLCLGLARLAVGAAVLARAARHRLVRLFLPRSRPRDAGRPGAGCQPGRRPRAVVVPRACRRPSSAWATQPLPCISIFINVFDVHVNRTPVPRHRRAAGLPSGQVPQRLARQGDRRERAPVLPLRAARRRARSASCRSPASSRGASSPSSRTVPASRRPARRPDPLRQPLRRLSAGGCRAAGPGRAAGARRRDRAGRPVRQPARAPGMRELMMPSSHAGRRRADLSPQAGAPRSQHAHHPGPVRRA